MRHSYFNFSKLGIANFNDKVDQPFTQSNYLTTKTLLILLRSSIHLELGLILDALLIQLRFTNPFGQV